MKKMLLLGLALASLPSCTPAPCDVGHFHHRYRSTIVITHRAGNVAWSQIIPAACVRKFVCEQKCKHTDKAEHTQITRRDTFDSRCPIRGEER